ncbi:hypothetical protein [Nocardia tengchongensis]|uniref:hypothetical protein n=1 Tax=Nocardia tengchongensis TaxID=2055889 RepID=UPI0036A9A441
MTPPGSRAAQEKSARPGGRYALREFGPSQALRDGKHRGDPSASYHSRHPDFSIALKSRAARLTWPDGMFPVTRPGQ